jgi:hypothetical protein
LPRETSLHSDRQSLDGLQASHNLKTLATLLTSQPQLTGEINEGGKEGGKIQSTNSPGEELVSAKSPLPRETSLPGDRQSFDAFQSSHNLKALATLLTSQPQLTEEMSNEGIEAVKIQSSNSEINPTLRQESYPVIQHQEDINYNSVSYLNAALEIDIEAILEAITEEIQQDYRRFYGG